MSTLKEKAKALKKDIPALFLSLCDKRTPWYAKILLALTVGYALSPIDLIPDFIPILGYLDDVLLLPFMVYLCIRMIPEDIIQENREKASDLWIEGRPKRWYYALPIVILYLFLFWWLFSKVLDSPLFVR